MIANFELALGAIATARAALDAVDLAEDTMTITTLKSKWFRCKMCGHGIREMVFEDLVSTCPNLWWNALGRPRPRPRAHTAPPLPEAHHAIRRARR